MYHFLLFKRHVASLIVQYILNFSGAFQLRDLHSLLETRCIQWVAHLLVLVIQIQLYVWVAHNWEIIFVNGTKTLGKIYTIPAVWFSDWVIKFLLRSGVLKSDTSKFVFVLIDCTVYFRYIFTWIFLTLNSSKLNRGNI